jgi:PAS domain S-box-containing protein
MKKESKEMDENLKLTEVEQKYRMFIEFAVDAFFQGDKKGNIITVNEKACQLTGYSMDELLSMNLSDLFTKQTLDDKPLRYDLLQTGSTVKTERTLISRDGVQHTVEMNSNLMPDGTYQSFFRDITERKKADRALVESEHKYRNLHNSMMDGFVFVNMDGLIIDSNKSFQQMVGYTADELLKLTYPDLTPQKWHEFENRLVIKQILNAGHSDVYQKEYIRKDGTIFPVELRTFLTRNGEGENEGMWAIVRDITARKHAELAIQESEEKFRSIVQSSPTAMHFYRLENDDRLVLTGANPVADRIIGLNHQELLGKTIEEAFPNLAKTEIPDMYKRVARGKIGHQSFEIEYKDERFSGFYQVFVFCTTPGGIAVDFIDISARKRSEEMTQRNAEQKEILLREIHHRVKNNLAIVISLLNFQMRRNDDPELARMIRDIQLRIRSMALIHEHLYKSENLDRIPLASYAQSLSAIILSAFSGQNIKLSTNLDAIDVSIETALPIGLILNELLTNAFKYAFPKNSEGTIEINLLREEGENCTLTVKDNGVGLPDSFSLESELSLGMYIIRLLTEQLDGSVEIEGKNGTSFIIRFRNILTKPRDKFLH